MFSAARNTHAFAIKGQITSGIIELVSAPAQIDQDAARGMLVQAFIAEYRQYLSPQEVDEHLDDWENGEHSVTNHYIKSHSQQ